jgi:MoxR-like ATPase
MSQSSAEERIAYSSSKLRKVLEQLGQQIVGQDNLRRRLLQALVADGHILLEGVPGLAKTLSIKAVAKAFGGSFRRIQFTPDILPADIVGTEVYRPKEGTFEVRRGPVFANFLLADEINRAPAKSQSALLETMQELQVTIGDETYQLPSPFFVLATQNPIEQEGTYPLPEAQIDRFIMKVLVDYPSHSEERNMLDLVTSESYSPCPESPYLSMQELEEAREAVTSVFVDERIKNYIVDLVWATRDPEKYNLDIAPLIELGASPRATISLYLIARAEALIEGQTYVTPQHIKDICGDVLRHRILTTYEAEARGITKDEIIKNILDRVEAP